MSGEAQGIVSDAGDAVQRKINQASDTQGQIVEYHPASPITATLIAVGIGYVLGK